MLEAEKVGVSQKDIDRSLEIQTQVSLSRYEYETAVSKHKERQKVYQRIIDLQKQLRIAEQEALDMEANEQQLGAGAEETKQVSIGKTWNSKEFVDIMDTAKPKQRKKSPNLVNGVWQ